GLYDGERLVGYIIATYEREWGENDLHIVNLSVDPEYRRRGVARFLLEQMLAYAHQLKVGRVYLEVRVNNQPAIELYRKCGFVITRRLERYYPRGLDGWEMVKPMNNFT
ncbi:MAG: GNAT family N-acetyltransferase, partial [bacterium]